MNNKLKILGFSPIFYIGDYFREALMSVEPFVDKMVIAYTEKPSQSNGDGSPCPDKEEDIYRIAQEVLGDKLIWDKAESYNTEASHRDVRYKYSAGFDVIVNLDADEVMIGIPEAIEYLMNSGAQYVGINGGYKNFFRSFSWICIDHFSPVRLENLHIKTGVQDLGCHMQVLHFSCAQRMEIMRFKYKNFGHSTEIKPNYLEEIFYKWSPENNLSDLHPVSYNLWNAVPFDKNTMPDYLKKHPNFNLDLIP